MSPRPKLDHVRKPQLLEAAAQVIQERGFYEARIADVAERVGIHPSTVLHYVASKDALLEEALIHWEEACLAAVREQLTQIASPREQLERIAAFCSEPPPGLDDWGLWIEMWRLARVRAEVRTTRRALDMRWRAMLAEVVHAGQQAGEFGDVDADAAAVLLAGLFDGLAIQVMLGDPDIPPARMKELCMLAIARLLERPGSGA